jgi:hypothetical protein
MLRKLHAIPVTDRRHAHERAAIHPIVAPKFILVVHQGFSFAWNVDWPFGLSIAGRCTTAI